MTLQTNSALVAENKSVPEDTTAKKTNI